MQMQKVFKLARFSANERPSVGSICNFFPIKYMTTNLFTIVKSTCGIVNGKGCKVLENTKHVVVVKFFGKTESDLVSPDFLVRLTLTKFGRYIFGEPDANDLSDLPDDSENELLSTV